MKKTHTETTDPITCCMCFGTFEDNVCNGDGAGWVSCYCGRWLHEECVEDYVVNQSGVELFVHFVLMGICCIKCICACRKLCTAHISNSTHTNEM